MCDQYLSVLELYEFLEDMIEQGKGEKPVCFQPTPQEELIPINMLTKSVYESASAIILKETK